jgi:hypothetical protein
MVDFPDVSQRCHVRMAYGLGGLSSGAGNDPPPEENLQGSLPDLDQRFGRISTVALFVWVHMPPWAAGPPKILPIGDYTRPNPDVRY